MASRGSTAVRAVLEFPEVPQSPEFGPGTEVAIIAELATFAELD